jgi:hypothetical protein
MSAAYSTPSCDDILVRDREFQPHLDALGLKSVEEYQQWCAQNGFSQRLDKHWRARCRERYFAAQQAVRQRLARAKEQKCRPRKILDRIFAGGIQADELVQPHWLLVFDVYSRITSDSVRHAFHKLLVHLQSGTALLTARLALPRLGGEGDDSVLGGALGRALRLLNRDRGPPPGNTFIDGLSALARLHELWIRPPTMWRPNSHSPSRQFSSLARHLLSKYPVPAFMDSVWFRGDSAEATRQQGWYVALAGGESPRNLDLLAPLRGQMARHFLRAPSSFLCEEAVRYGQVMGLGGDERLVRTLLGSRLGTSFEHNDFWVTVILWLIRHPLLDPARVAPLIDFIYRQRFEPQDAGIAGAVESRPADPHFTMKGRTPESLLRQMGAWHVQLRKEPPKAQLEWSPSGLASFEFSEGTVASGNLRRWTIVELLSRRALFEEGRTMKHCVASYDGSCAFGRSSIWSLGLERNGGERKRVLTIEVSNARRTICQVRGKANRLPSLKEIDILRSWAAQEQLAPAAHIGG